MKKRFWLKEKLDNFKGEIHDHKSARYTWLLSRKSKCQLSKF